MGGEGRHPDKALTSVQTRALKAPGRYADGNGLYLVVEPSVAKRWLLRTVVQGRRRDIGLGGLTSSRLLKPATRRSPIERLHARAETHLAERRKTLTTVPTFAEAAEQVHLEHKASWRNPKHAAQWVSTLQTYAYPHFGTRRVDSIDTPDVLRALSPISLTKPETARRVRQRIGTVLDWAKAAGHRIGENPIEGVTRGLPKQGERDEHHAALPYAEVPAFVARLRESNQGDCAQRRTASLSALNLIVVRLGDELSALLDLPDEVGVFTSEAKRELRGRLAVRLGPSPAEHDGYDISKRPVFDNVKSATKSKCDIAAASNISADSILTVKASVSRSDEAARARGCKG